MAELIREIPVEDWYPDIVIRHRGYLMVLEHGEYCCACKTTDNLIAFALPTADVPMGFTTCENCQGDKFRDWFINELEQFFMRHPEQWRKNPNGTWTEITPPQKGK